MKKLIFLFLFLYFQVPQSFGQVISNSNLRINQKLASANKIEEAFDFWIGEWKVSWEDRNGDSLYGKNSIKKIAGGKIIHELFRDNMGNYSGTSISIYDSKEEIWKQTWMDNRETCLNFVSKPHPKFKIFEAKEPGKEGELLRMVFKDIQINSFTWEWQSSSDAGRNWMTRWRIWYERLSR